MKQPYTTLEKKYLIEQRVLERIKKYGSIQNAIKHCESMLKECEDNWDIYSYDCVGHSIICNQLLINRLKEFQNEKNN